MSHATPTRGGQFCPDHAGVGDCLASAEFFAPVMLPKAAAIEARAVALSPRGTRKLSEPRPRYAESFHTHAGRRRDASGTRYVVTVYNDNPHQHPYYVETGNERIDTYAPLRRALGQAIARERTPGRAAGATARRAVRRADR